MNIISASPRPAFAFVRSPLWGRGARLLLVGALATGALVRAQDQNVAGNLTVQGNATINNTLTATSLIASGGTLTGGSSGLTLSSGDANQSITLLPNGSGSIFLNGKVGVGTSAPAGMLHLVDSSNNAFYLDGYSAGSSGPVIRARKARGTAAAPRRVLTGDVLGGFNAFGAFASDDSTDAVFLGPANGMLRFHAAEDFTVNDRGTYFTISTSPKGYNLSGAVERLRITDAGNVGIGTQAPATKLDVAGDVHSSGNVTVDGSLTVTGALNVDAASSYQLGGEAVLRIIGDGLYLGSGAGNSSSTGTGNTGVGAGALAANTTGSSNTALGYHALNQNTTGLNNVAFGHNALAANTTAGGNLAFGVNALAAATTGGNNVAIGTSALASVVSGGNNVAIGRRAGNNATGSSNVLVGYQAGYSSIGAGSNNILLGTLIEAPVSGGSNQLSIGNLIFGTGVDGSGTTLSSGNVGIGVAAPTAKLDVAGGVNISGDAAISGSATVGNITVTGTLNAPNFTSTGAVAGTNGLFSGQIRTGGATSANVSPNGIALANNNYISAAVSANNDSYKLLGLSAANVVQMDLSALGVEFGGAIKSNRLTGGSAAGSSLTLQSTSGAGTSDFIKFVVGSNGATEAMRITTAGNVGIGVTAPTQKLEVAGSASTSADSFFNGIRIGRGQGNTDTNVVVGSGNTGSNANLTGTYNTLFGRGIAPMLSSGSTNLFLGGNNAGAVSTGSENIILGYSSGDGLATGNTNTIIGHRAGAYLSAGSSRNVFLGGYSGRYETGSDAFYVNNRDWTTTAAEKTGSLLYGTFNSTPANQTLTLNAATTVAQNLSVLGTGNSSFAGNVGIGTNPTAKLDVAGDAKVSGNATVGNLAVTGAFSASTFAAANVTSSTALTLASGGGDQDITLDPSGAGTVRMAFAGGKELRFSEANTTTPLISSSGSLKLGTASGSNGAITIAANGGGAQATFAAGGSIDLTAQGSGASITLTPGSTGAVVLNGKLGIGTPAPDDNLTVNGNSTLARAASAGGSSYAVVKQENGSTGYVGFQQRGTTAASSAGIGGISGLSEVLANGTGGLAVFTVDATPLLFGTGYTERMRILVNGNVGIGTSTATRKLDVSGDARVTSGLLLGSTGFDSAQLALARSTDGALIGQIYQSPSITYFDNLQGGGTDLRVASGGSYTRAFVRTEGFGVQGKDGAGPFSLSAALQVRSSTDTSGSFTLKAQNSSGGDLFAVRGDGNVGIGTAAPAAKLDVNGGANISGNVTLGTNLSVVGTFSAANFTGGTLTGGASGLTLNAGASGQNVTLQPGSGGYTLLGGSVGIGTSTPAADTKLDVAGVARTQGVRITNLTNAPLLGTDASGNLKSVTTSSLTLTGAQVTDALTYTPANKAGDTLTGNLKLVAGNETVAPLTLQSGTNLTTPTFGAVEFDGTNVFVTNNASSPTRKTLAYAATTLSGYGITDPVLLSSGSYANPAWLASLSASKLTGTLPAAAMPAHTGEVTSAAGSTVLALSNTGVTAGTYAKVTVDPKGRVTAGAALTQADVQTALEFVPYNASNPAGYITSAGVPVQSVFGRTGAVTLLNTDVSNALGYQPVSKLGDTLSGTLRLAAGTTTAASLQLQTGANLDTPVVGAVEFDGANVSVTTNGASGPTRKTLAYAATTLSGYGITDPVLLSSGSYANPAWLASLSASKLTGTLAASALPAFTGEVTSSAGSNTLTLANSGVTAGTYSKVTVDARGRVTAGLPLAPADVTNALGFAPVQSVFGRNGNVAMTAGDVENALGYVAVKKTGDTLTGALSATALIASGGTVTGGTNGLTLAAGGSDNQNIVLTPTGTGSTQISGDVSIKTGSFLLTQTGVSGWKGWPAVYDVGRPSLYFQTDISNARQELLTVATAGNGANRVVQSATIVGGTSLNSIAATPAGSNYQLRLNAYDGTNWIGNVAAIEMVNETLATASNHPTSIRFSTTAPGATDRAERLRIAPNGNVGIGTDAPSDTLHLKQIGTAEVSTGGGILALQNLNGNVYRFYGASGSTQLLLGTPGLRLAGFDTNGNFAAGGLSGDSIMANPALFVSGVNKNVGIGTTDPISTAKLDVNGNTRIGGDLTVTGNATVGSLKIGNQDFGLPSEYLKTSGGGALSVTSLTATGGTITGGGANGFTISSSGDGGDKNIYLDPADTGDVVIQSPHKLRMNGANQRTGEINVGLPIVGNATVDTAVLDFGTTTAGGSLHGSLTSTSGAAVWQLGYRTTGENGSSSFFPGLTLLAGAQDALVTINGTITGNNGLEIMAGGNSNKNLILTPAGTGNVLVKNGGLQLANNVAISFQDHTGTARQILRLDGTENLAIGSSDNASVTIAAGTAANIILNPGGKVVSSKPVDVADLLSIGGASGSPVTLAATGNITAPSVLNLVVGTTPVLELTAAQAKITKPTAIADTSDVVDNSSGITSAALLVDGGLGVKKSASFAGAVRVLPAGSLNVAGNTTLATTTLGNTTIGGPLIVNQSATFNNGVLVASGGLSTNGGALSAGNTVIGGTALVGGAAEFRTSLDFSAPGQNGQPPVAVGGINWPTSGNDPLRLIAGANRGLSLGVDNGTKGITIQSSGLVTTTGNLAVGTNESKSALTLGTDAPVVTTTADNKYVAISGGTANNAANAATIELSGNGRTQTGGDVVITAGNVAGGDIRFGTGGVADRMIVTDDGRVGVGTAPNAKFDVAGDGRFSSTLTVGGITSISSSVNSTTVGNGALVVGGGAGVNGNVNVGGALKVGATESATTIAGGAVSTTGAVSAASVTAVNQIKAATYSFQGGNGAVSNDSSGLLLNGGSTNRIVAQNNFVANGTVSAQGRISTTSDLLVGTKAGIGLGSSGDPQATLHVSGHTADGEIARFEQGGSGAQRSYLRLSNRDPAYWWEMSVQNDTGTGNQNGFALWAKDNAAGAASKPRFYVSSPTPEAAGRSFVRLYAQNPTAGWEFSVEDPDGGGGEQKGLAFRPTRLEGSAFVSSPAMYIAPTGEVGIGTANPGAYKLAVNGTIRATEILVEQDNLPDYVFSDNYRNAPLSEVEQHIKEHKHLPGVPSAQQVASEGMSVGQMQGVLLQKVEELTLHLIEQEKRIKRLEEENASLRAAR